MFLEERNLQTSTEIDALEAKYWEIQTFTRLLFADMHKAERTSHQAVQRCFEELKVTLFKNLGHILNQPKYADSGSAQKALREAQLNMIFDWEQFRLTKDMFFKLYQCHRNQLINDANMKARAILIK